MENRFYKVNQTGGCYVTALFFNPVTKETRSCCVRDCDYSDGSRDRDDLYYMPIDKDAQKLYYRHIGVISVGDTVRVVKGRKVPIGTISEVVRIYDWKDCYGRVQATYAVLKDGSKTSVYNCELV